MRTCGRVCRIAGNRDLGEERDVRLSAVRLVRWAGRLGIDRAAVAGDMGMSVRTLREWERRWAADRLEARPRGRPRTELDRGQRQTALWLLHSTLGRVSVHDLQQCVWPPASRAALVDLKARWRYAAHRRGGRLSAHVVWPRAGSVWAMDWTNPDWPMEEGYAGIFVVRDLASGKQLLALPCMGESGKLVARELEILVARWGAPAAVKEDNGGSLRCGEVGLVLACHGILALPSPPACPGYNGACEAGIGSLKVRAHHLAAAAGRGSSWSCDDIEAARLARNACARASGLSANDVWGTRRPIGDREREELWSLYRTHQAQERRARGIEPRAQLQRLEQASLDRAAIARALEEVGLVRFRRRWIRPPIRGRKRSRKP